MTKAEFVVEFGKVLSMAKPHLVKCEYKKGNEIEAGPFDKIIPNGEYVVITCENDYQYKVDVTADNFTGIMIDVINAMQHK